MTDAAMSQLQYINSGIYKSFHLFGLSASEVPMPLEVPAENVYHAWGIGGRFTKEDGTGITGYPVVAPHYAALIAKEHESASSDLFDMLANSGYFSPLNNVESIGITSSGKIKYNSMKGSWNLCLQALGAARALSGTNYLPYEMLLRNEYLSKGYEYIMRENE